MRQLYLTRSIATRLAIGNGALLGVLILLICSGLYFGTVGVLDGTIDGKISSIAERLLATYDGQPQAQLIHEIEQELSDGIDSDTEIFLVTDAAGQRVVGNLTSWPALSAPVDQLINRDVVRDGRPVSARLMMRRLADGGLLYVGRDLSELRSIRDLVLHALEVAVITSLLLVVVGGWWLRRQIEQRIGQIRQTAHRIERGDLSRRIAISGDDEFARLSVDINRMLDRIEQLMSGVQHVSNAIAHDLRTPLGRIRARLEAALRDPPDTTTLNDAARGAIEGIDELIQVFNKLLQIAEAESGMRAQAFEPVDLRNVITDMVELYDAAAEEHGVALRITSQLAVWARGDHDLLVNAVASLIDNGIKYAGHGREVRLSVSTQGEIAQICVEDNGVGVSQAQLPRLTERFYRVERARNKPGNGLGLAIVEAIAKLHGGMLQIGPATPAPGLRVVLTLPASDAARGAVTSVS